MHGISFRFGWQYVHHLLSYTTGWAGLPRWGVTLPGIVGHAPRRGTGTPGELERPGSFRAIPDERRARSSRSLFSRFWGIGQPVIHVAGWSKRAGWVSPRRQMEAKVRYGLGDKLTRIGAKVLSYARYVAFQMAKMAVSQRLFWEILDQIGRWRTGPELVGAG